ncbi:hypothetical protein [Erwinia sp. B116]|uniref:hypothetical protein n=1 Tax=Erwinia sp. B116 TaxID=1561024 RepID=UPI0011AFC2CF|nr:hypothetical protein [Erwinia sp. B116]
MNHDREETKRLERVSPEVFATFLRAKKVAQCCMSCGGSRLVVPETDDAAYSASLAGSSSFAEKKYVIWYKISESKPASPDNCEYRVICSECGFTSYYWASLVVLWLEADLFPVEKTGGKK